MAEKILFPRRFTRRDFLATSAAAGAAMALPAMSQVAQARASTPVRIGEGQWTYTLDENWGKLPAGMTYGFGCAIVVDSKDRIIVTSRSMNPCVAIFDRDGALLETWSNDFAGKVGTTTSEVAATAHGLYWSKEPDGEFLYFTENKSKDPAHKTGKRVYKTDMQGRVLYELGNVASEGSTSQKFEFDNPTDVAVAPNGDIYIVDGYGSQLVHRFDKHFKHLKTIGGKGEEHGLFKVCHGVWVSTLGKGPEVYIADRANNRLEVYSPELEYKRTIEGVRLPCCFYQHAGHLYVPELGARVSILDADDKFVAQLGDGQGVKKEEITPDKFATPHALTVDSHGDLYVVEWLDYGRVRKFKHTPGAA
jgi:DNA-binding beta-propeller fold protein YncE